MYSLARYHNWNIDWIAVYLQLHDGGGGCVCSRFKIMKSGYSGLWHNNITTFIFSNKNKDRKTENYDTINKHYYSIHDNIIKHVVHAESSSLEMNYVKFSSTKYPAQIRKLTNFWKLLKTYLKHPWSFSINNFSSLLKLPIF